jgi:hypothetical protein
MKKISKTIIATVLLVLHFAIATYSNLLYGAVSVVYPGLYSGCATSETVWATDRIITRFE